MIVREKSKLMMYVGADPTGKAGILKKAIGNFTQAELSQLDVSFRGTEANNIFLEPVFFDDDLRGQFRILGNVANKKKMVFVQQLENIVRKYSGCGFNPVGSVSIYDRTIDVEKMKVDLDRKSVV